MSFAEELAAFRAEHPLIDAAEVFVVDLNGIVRGKLVPMATLAKLAEGKMRLPVSTLGLDVFGLDVAEAAIALEAGDPDGALVPVPGSLGPMLWAEAPTAQVQCTVTDPDRDGPAAYDPRGVLAGVVERAAGMGLKAVMALEVEFYLIDRARAAPPENPLAGGRLRRSQLYDLEVMRGFSGLLTRIGEAADALGAPAETAICEFGPGQFEVNLAHVPDPLAAADHLIALKRAIRGAARADGLDATFMAKPYGDDAGSGMHLHISLLDDDGRNVFERGDGDGPNSRCRHAVAGLLRHIGDAMLIFAPHLNSYRRFVPGSYAPITAAWGLDNRGVAVRVPETGGPGARIEHRVSGADANPYLLAAALLAAALDGIEAGEEPPAPQAAEAGRADGEPLPLSWAMAEDRFARSDFVARWLGAEFRRIYGAMKRQERETLLARVSDVEYEAYLRVV